LATANIGWLHITSFGPMRPQLTRLLPPRTLLPLFALIIPLHIWNSVDNHHQSSQWYAQDLVSLHFKDALNKGLPLSALISAVREHRRDSYRTALPPIAHAGGAIEGKLLTNSISALDANYARGFTWFEIDFQWTADRVLVCGHDWEQTIATNYGIAFSQAPAFAPYMEALRHHRDRPCTIPELAAWLYRHPNARIITDIKGSVPEALRSLAKVIPDHETRLIPQIYSPEQYKIAVEQGYEDVIWTLYRYNGSDRAVLAALTDIKPFAVTVSEPRLLGGIGLILKRAGVPVYTHTINNAQKAYEYRAAWGAQQVYTDTLDAVALSQSP
jgi:glycerophosphoryl diester phosphodiesterase